MLLLVGVIKFVITKLLAVLALESRDQCGHVQQVDDYNQLGFSNEFNTALMLVDFLIYGIASHLFLLFSRFSVFIVQCMLCRIMMESSQSYSWLGCFVALLLACDISQKSASCTG